MLRLRSFVDAERASHLGAARRLDGVKRIVQQFDEANGPACVVFVALTLGLTLVAVTACVLTAGLKWVDLLPHSFTIGDSILNGLAHTDFRPF